MTTFEILKNKLAERSVETVVAALTVLIAWIASQVAPFVIPAIQNIPKEIFLSFLLLSFVTNIFLGFLIWMLKPNFTVKYGIYWDKAKNPHCPNCKIPIGAYANYRNSGWGYYCKPCGKVFRLTDASGNDIKPERVLLEL